MNESVITTVSENLLPKNYLSVGLSARKSREKQFRLLLEKKKVPHVGWEDSVIEEFVNYISSLDSNNFPKQCRVGEREGRIVCQLVAKRHYNFAHGIGRSGDLLEAQPKACGSSILVALTNALVLDFLKCIGIQNTKYCFVAPMATGMTLNLCFLSLKRQRPTAKYILWSRIDQKSCVKSMVKAGLEIIVIDPVWSSTGFQTNVDEFKSKLNELPPDKILSIFSTTSCFAPRNCDNITELAKLSQLYNIPHVVNNAYGLQSTFLTHQIEQASRLGNIDLFVQSTDKNFLVPVGGAVVAGFNEEIVKDVAKIYVGRGSSSQTLDVLITLLSLGKTGYMRLFSERKEIFEYLGSKLRKLAQDQNESVLTTKNPISIAFTLNTVAENATMLGSMLYIRGISGARVITGKDTKTVGTICFQGWGSHCENVNITYITFAASLGITKNEIDELVLKFGKCLNELKRGHVRATAD